MAGQLTIDTLRASSGVLATQNGMTGIAKAWVNYNGSTQTIAGSFNVSSVTYNAAGDYRINFTTALPNANGSVCVTNMTDNATYTRIGSLAGSAPLTTTYVNVLFYEYNSRTAGNVSMACISVFSS
jgi:hypothetical protein